MIADGYICSIVSNGQERSVRQMGKLAKENACAANNLVSIALWFWVNEISPIYIFFFVFCFGFREMRAYTQSKIWRKKKLLLKRSFLVDAAAATGTAVARWLIVFVQITKKNKTHHVFGFVTCKSICTSNHFYSSFSSRCFCFTLLCSAVNWFTCYCDFSTVYFGYSLDAMCNVSYSLHINLK